LNNASRATFAGDIRGSIPVSIFWSTRLDIVARVTNHAVRAVSRNASDLVSYADEEPAAAALYSAALLTAPRAALTYAYMLDPEGPIRVLGCASTNALVRSQRATPPAVSP
jgi:hypothetical protein